jgi:hypothetical protein
MARHVIMQKLAGGDRRSIGKADEVVNEVLEDPRLFDTLFESILAEAEVVRMRAADAIEKITVKRRETLQPYKGRLMEEVARLEQKEVRWHVAQMLPRAEPASMRR